MANIKKDDYALTETLQVRISKNLRREMKDYLAKHKGYKQSDFVRDAMTEKIFGEHKDIERKAAIGTILGKKINEEWRKGVPSKDTVDWTVKVLYPDELFERIYKQAFNDIKVKLEEQGLKIEIQIPKTDIEEEE